METEPAPAPQGRPIASRNEGLSVKQAAVTAQVHEQTVRNWIRSGALPITRFGPGKGIMRIHPDDLQDIAGPH